jgi:hypothetical protein
MPLKEEEGHEFGEFKVHIQKPLSSSVQQEE